MVKSWRVVDVIAGFPACQKAGGGTPEMVINFAVLHSETQAYTQDLVPLLVALVEWNTVVVSMSFDDFWGSGLGFYMF